MSKIQTWFHKMRGKWYTWHAMLDIPTGKRIVQGKPFGPYRRVKK